MKPATILTIIVTLATLIACNDDTITPQGNSPAYVLELVEESFNRRAVSVLDGVLSDDFVFYFDQSDVGDDVGGFIIPDSWGRDDHMNACENMLAQIYSIDFNINTSNIEDPGEGDTTFEAGNVQIKLLVMIDSVNGYLAYGFCDFKLVYDDSAGYDDWKVTEWYDHTAAGGSAGLLSSSTPASFGSILANFH